MRDGEINGRNSWENDNGYILWFGQNRWHVSSSTESVGKLQSFAYAEQENQCPEKGHCCEDWNKYYDGEWHDGGFDFGVFAGDGCSDW